MDADVPTSVTCPDDRLPLPEPAMCDPNSIMKTTLDEGEQRRQTPERCKSPAQVIKEWIPFCEDDLKPKEGLEFANLEECEKFYKSYAHHVGFSIRKSTSKKSKEGTHKYKYYVCSKEGFRLSSSNMNPNRKVGVIHWIKCPRSH